MVVARPSLCLVDTLFLSTFVISPLSFNPLVSKVMKETSQMKLSSLILGQAASQGWKELSLEPSL